MALEQETEAALGIVVFYSCILLAAEQFPAGNKTTARGVYLKRKQQSKQGLRVLIGASDFCLYSCPQSFFIYLLSGSGTMVFCLDTQLEWQQSISPLAFGSTFDPTSHALPILLFSHSLSFASILHFFSTCRLWFYERQ